MIPFMTTWHSWDDSQLWFTWYHGSNISQRPWAKESVQQLHKGAKRWCIFPGKEWEESCYGGTRLCVFFLCLLLSSSFFLLLLCDEISVICLPVCVLSLFPGINEVNKFFSNTLWICLTSPQGTEVSWKWNWNWV